MSRDLRIIENELVPVYEASHNFKWYSEKIVDMVKQIENEKFLRRIYIILNDYICEFNF